MMQRFDKVPQPRYVNFFAAFLAAEKGATRADAIAACFNAASLSIETELSNGDKFFGKCGHYGVGNLTEHPAKSLGSKFQTRSTSPKHRTGAFRGGEVPEPDEHDHNMNKAQISKLLNLTRH